MATPPELHATIRQQGVLVVDDSTVQRQNIVEQLRRIGVSKIFEAGNGRDALKLLHSLFQPPAIVVLDLEMPDMDGIETAQQLAVDGLRPGLVIASSAELAVIETVGTMIETLGLPLLGALRKPISCADLRAALARFGATASEGGKAPAAASVGVDVETLRQAIAEGRIAPHYQPKILLADGRVAGVEALARWRAASGTLIGPSEFIATAERHGLIGELTLSMLDAVIGDLTGWHEAGFYPMVALNVCAATLSDRSFANEIIGRVESARISPSALILEITESALVSDLAGALATLGRLRLKGYSLSIDDYGTGFSSMQQLSRLPFTELKIDRSFVNHANEKWQLRTILESAIGMGRRLGLSTVAEGVETQQELELLRALGCEYAQGYLIAPPMSAAKLLPWKALEGGRLRALCASAATARAG
jgi:EAL domain-containing protein (putative c-di-GMP-specific phosphodiesterase class I)/FixJ family two-component response regulator